MEKTKRLIKQISQLWSNNTKVVENYFFMTFLSAAVVLINLLLYPYLIRTLGKETYGTYIFIFSNIQIFILFLASGFSIPALKKISLNPDDLKIKSQTVSEVFTTKLLLYSCCAVLLALSILLIPFVRENAVFYLIIFAMSCGDLFFPLWYFQGMQKMKFVTYINLGIRLTSIPLILIFVKSPADLFEYTLIVSVLPLLGNIFTFVYLIVKEHIRIRFVSFKTVKFVLHEALPFYWTTAFSRMKGESVKFITGIFFGMDNVAVYDLASKIINIASMLIGSINTAIFPKAVKDINSERIKRIFCYETIIGLSIMVGVIAFGYWAVLILGGRDMLNAYPLIVILSVTIFTSLIIVCYTHFVFIPQNRYYFVTKNQLISLISFLVFATIGFFTYKNMLMFVVALTLSNVVEVIYCHYVTQKHKLL